MATKLYNKEGKEQFFPAKRVQGALKAGWSVTKPKKKAPKAENAKAVTVEVTEEEKQDAADAEIKAENAKIETPVDFMAGAVEQDEAMIRQLAKEAGIGNYWNKNIDALKQELEL